MAIKCDYTIQSSGVNLTNAHTVINTYQEKGKGTLAVLVAVWARKEDYLNKFPAVDMSIKSVSTAELVIADDIRASIYNWLMTQPEFSNPVADMDDDFPVTSA